MDVYHIIISEKVSQMSCPKKQFMGNLVYYGYQMSCLTIGLL